MSRPSPRWILASLLLLYMTPVSWAVSAQPSAYVRKLQTLRPEDSTLSALGGLPFPPGSGAILVLDETGSGATLVFSLAAGRPGFATLKLSAPINTAFDARAGRMLILEPSAGQLVEIGPGADRRPDPKALSRAEARPLGVELPRGMTLDPDSGRLFVLDGAGPRIARIDPHPLRGLDLPAVAREGRRSWIDLGSSRLTDLEGLAFDPSSGHLHVLSPADEQLYELTQAGVVVAARDLSGAGLREPAGMVFAPSADQTDDPARQSLYVAAQGGAGGTLTELSFAQPLVAAPAAVTTTSSLVQTIDLSQFNPPSPDSAGITYLPEFGTLFVSDSEVNEMPIFTGDNLFEVNLSGHLVDTFTTIDFSDEPTGVSYDPDTGTLYVSDDTGSRELYIVDLGSDGQYGTNDDDITSFEPPDFNSNDPEGVTFADGDLYISDGVNSEVYHVRPGSNGVFDGVPPAGDDQVSHFDTESLGVTDPEGIAYNTDNGNLYVIGKPSDRVAEITTSGALVQMIDVSAANASKPAGLAYAPSSVNPGAMNLYIAQRGVDNDSDPNENDGKVYEMTLPSASCSSDADCDDGLFCNGQEACSAGACQGGADPCPGEDCDEASQTCTPITCNLNGVCDPAEDCDLCPADCIGAPPGCGNGFCEPSLGENCLSCSQDCNGKQKGRPDRQFCCGDGAGSNPAGCGDLRCNSGGFLCSDIVTGGYCCGDAVCEGAEDTSSCALDCGDPPTCGDAFCDAGAGESMCSCAADCGSPPGSEVSCSNGLDDDCDGLVDDADPDCCTRAQKGDACTQDADCCSNRCRGRRGVQVCK